MSFLASNLRHLRKYKSITQQELAEQLSVKRAMISAYEDGRSEPKLKTLQSLCEILEVSLEELLNHDIVSHGRVVTQKRNLNILTIACDDQENENITLVRQRASAGYLNGFADQEYMEQLPQFNLPTLPSQTT